MLFPAVPGHVKVPVHRICIRNKKNKGIQMLHGFDACMFLLNAH